MSLWLLRKLSRCSSFSLEQCKSLPQHINHKLSVQLHWSASKSIPVLHSQLPTAASHKSKFELLGDHSTASVEYQSLQGLSSSSSSWRRGSRETGEPTKDSSPTSEKTQKGSTVDQSSSHRQSKSADFTPDEISSEERRQELWKQGPYPHNTPYERSEARFSYRPAVDPSTTSIILFPGQGTQYVGMGKDLQDIPEVQEMYTIASDILGFDLLETSLHGPEDMLSRTQVQQPAILVASLAAVERLRQTNPGALESCVGVAGFSVGELTALTFAGAFTFEDAVQLIKVRAEAMQAASELVAGGMVTTFYGPKCRLGLCCDTAKEFCRSREVIASECKIASFLGPSCKVVGGSEEALEFLQQNMADLHIKRLKRLNVSGAFHTEHMKPAAEHLKEALRNMTIHSPNVPVHSNIDGRPYRHPDQIRKNLPRQIYSSVKWEQTMNILYSRKVDEKYPETFECGPGQSLKAILKMNNAKAAEHFTNVGA